MERFNLRESIFCLDLRLGNFFIIFSKIHTEGVQLLGLLRAHIRRKVYRLARFDSPGVRTLEDVADERDRFRVRVEVVDAHDLVLQCMCFGFENGRPFFDSTHVRL